MGYKFIAVPRGLHEYLKIRAIQGNKTLIDYLKEISGYEYFEDEFK